MSEDVHTHPPEVEPRRLERAATWLSFACALHCLLMPVATLALPAVEASSLGRLHADLELALTTLVVVSVGAGFLWGFRRHRDLRVAAGLGAGLVAYLAGHTLEGSGAGLGLSIAGALMLASASFVGARLSHNCEHAH